MDQMHDDIAEIERLLRQIRASEERIAAAKRRIAEMRARCRENADAAPTIDSDGSI